MGRVLMATPPEWLILVGRQICTVQAQTMIQEGVQSSVHIIQILITFFLALSQHNVFSPFPVSSSCGFAFFASEQVN